MGVYKEKRGQFRNGHLGKRSFSSLGEALNATIKLWGVNKTILPTVLPYRCVFGATMRETAGVHWHVGHRRVMHHFFRKASNKIRGWKSDIIWKLSSEDRRAQVRAASRAARTRRSRTGQSRPSD